MIFGTRERFGIECHIIRSSEGLLIGDLWLWANGWRIGDEVSGVDLPLILSALSGPLFLKEHRHAFFFDKLDKEQVVDFFLRLIFSKEELNGDLATIAHLFRRYLVISAPDLEGFDSVFLLLLGHINGGDRLIWKYRKMDLVYEIILDHEEYDERLLSCMDWIEQKTGYRSPQRTWLGLPEFQRNELRQSIILLHPDLGQSKHRELLDQVVIEKLNQNKL